MLIGGYELLLEKIGAGSRVGAFSTSLGPRYIPVNTPYGAIWTVALLPIVIEAYDTPFFTTEILISFLLCGLRLQAFCKAVSARGYAPRPFVLRIFSFHDVHWIFRALWTKRKGTNSRQRLSCSS